MSDLFLIQPVPAGSANGTPLPNPPSNIRGVVLYIPPAATPNSVSYAIASAQPASAPTSVTMAGASAPLGTAVIMEPLLPGQNLYITAGGANCSFRWLQGG